MTVFDAKPFLKLSYKLTLICLCCDRKVVATTLLYIRSILFMLVGKCQLFQDEVMPLYHVPENVDI